jgi:hypothetical protein
MARVNDPGTGGSGTGGPPPRILNGKINPAYVTWFNNQTPQPAPGTKPYGQGTSLYPTSNAPPNAPAQPKPTGGAGSSSGTSETVNINGELWHITYDSSGKVTGRVDLGPAPTSGPKGDPSTLPSGVAGGSTPMTAYEQAQIALDKQKVADAEAQQKADQEYRNAQALDAFNKQWQDYQTKNYYGSFYGPSAAAPAGAPMAFRLPEPSYVQDFYKNNPASGPDPFSQPMPYSGYSGSGFLNPQQPGIQNAGAIPAGAVPAPIAGGAQAQPFAGVSQGQAAAFNPNAPQSGQNVPTGMQAGGTQPVTQGQLSPMGGGMTGAMQSPAMGKLDPNILNAFQSHPAANQFVMSLPGAQQFVAQSLGSSGAMQAPISGGSNG